MNATWDDPAPGAGPNTGMDVPPHRLCCGQRHFGVQCPDGKVMCCICFSRFPVDQLHVDPSDGRPVDVCTGCEALNEEGIRRLLEEPGSADHPERKKRRRYG